MNVEARLLNVEARLRELLALRPDWDSYGARAISPKAAEAVQQLVSFMGAPIELSPCPHGGLLVVWRQAGVQLELEILEVPCTED